MAPHRFYYKIKPLIPWQARMCLRRYLATRKRKRYAGEWPINHSAGNAPENWQGWPEGKRFAFVLTHDVESRIGLKRCPQLMEFEMNLGMRSSFNFIPEGDYKVSKEFRDELLENGFEVGVHDLHHDGHLYRNRESFRNSSLKINSYLDEWDAVGFRGGFMLRNLDWIHDLNLLYDASTFDTDPFEPQPNGVGTIFPYWIPKPDLTKGDGERSEGYVELPYSLPQDSTLFRLFRERDINTWKRKLDWIAEKGGMALLNLHPDYVHFKDREQTAATFPVSYYGDLIDYLKTKYKDEFWQPLPMELAQWYKSNYVKTENEFSDIKVNISSIRKIGSGSSDCVEKTQISKQPIPIGEIMDTKAAYNKGALAGKKAAVVLLSKYPNDPRPRRAAEALANEGMEVDLICIKQTVEESNRETFNGVNVLRLPMQHTRGGKLNYLLHYFSFILASFCILTFRSLTRRYDIVHVHNMPDVLVFSSLVPKMLGARVVLDLHDPMPELMRTIYGMEESSKGVRLLKFCEKISMGFAHAVITVNETCKKIFSNRSCPNSKISVVMNAVDENMFSIIAPKSRTITEESKFIVMYHGSLVERNGLGLAVEAINLLESEVRSRVELRVYGENTEFLQSILKEAESKGISSSINYVGPKSIEGIVSAIDDCDIGIIPNLKNIFTELNTPTRIFEFLSRGKAVISPLAPGVLEYFSEDSLIMFELGNALDLASKIEYAYKNCNNLDLIAEKGQEICLKHRWSEERKGFIEIVENQLRKKSVDLKIA